MAELSINLGNQKLTVVDSAFGDVALKMLPGPFEIANTKTMDILPKDPIAWELRAERPIEWKFAFPEGASLTVGLDLEASSMVVLRRRSALFPEPTGPDIPADDELALPPVVRPSANPERAYVSIQLKVSLTAAATGGWTHGLVGFKVEGGSTQRFQLTYHHAVDPSTQITEAISEAFGHFVLPYDPDVCARLSADCFVEWEHSSRLDVGVTAFAGTSAVLLGARGRSELARLVSRGPMSRILQPQAQGQIGAAFQISYFHEDAFRSVLGADSAKHRRLFIYQMDQRALTLGLVVKAQIDLQSSAQADLGINAAIGDALKQFLPATAGVNTKQQLTAAARDDLKHSVLSYLKSLGAQATLAHEQISEAQSLLAYRFEGSDAEAAQLALTGKLQQGTSQGRLLLLPGSTVKETLTQVASMKFLLMGLAEASSTDAFIQASECYYDGGGLFTLRYSADRHAQETAFGHGKEVDVLFTGRAQAFADQRVLAGDVRLRITFRDLAKPEAAKRTASALALILDGKADSTVARLMRDAISQDPSLETELICSVAPTAFRRVPYTRFEQPDKPRQLPQASDSQNYQAFLDACESLLPAYLESVFPQGGNRFVDWAQFNIAINSSPEARLENASRPNRRQSSWSGTNWPEFGRLSGVQDSSRRNMIAVFFAAAASFMNACEDLQVLAQDLDETQTASAFQRLKEDMEKLAGKEISGAFPLFFGKPALVALVRQMNPSVLRVVAPDVDPPLNHVFRVRVEIA